MKTIGIVIVLAIAMEACGSSADNGCVEPEVTTKWVCAATAGADGGQGGSVLVLYRDASSEPDSEAFRSAFTLDGGRAGPGGQAGNGAPGSDGQAGAPGEFEAIRETDYVFDDAGIEADRFVDIGSDNIIYLEDNADPMPPMRLDTFRIRAGAHFELGCDVRIQARSFVVEAGARLTIRGGTAWTAPSVSASRSTAGPGSTAPRSMSRPAPSESTDSWTLAATREDPGVAGGHGGKLILRAERLELGADASILAHGGDGGPGVDERACPPRT